MIEERLTWAVVVRILAASRVTLGADIEFFRSGARFATRGIAARRIQCPRHAVAVVQFNRETARRHRTVSRHYSSECHVTAAGAMTGLATHADFRPLRGVAVIGRVVLLLDHRRMAVRAHEIPVLLAPGPVQLVAVRNLLVGIKVEPALATLFPGSRVPCDGQRLHAPA